MLPKNSVIHSRTSSPKQSKSLEKHSAVVMRKMTTKTTIIRNGSLAQTEWILMNGAKTIATMTVATGQMRLRMTHSTLAMISRPRWKEYNSTKLTMELMTVVTYLTKTSYGCNTLAWISKQSTNVLMEVAMSVNGPSATDGKNVMMDLMNGHLQRKLLLPRKQ